MIVKYVVDDNYNISKRYTSLSGFIGQSTVRVVRQGQTVKPVNISTGALKSIPEDITYRLVHAQPSISLTLGIRNAKNTTKS